MSAADDLDEMIVLYTQDRTPLSRIAIRFGCTEAVVRDLLVGAGVVLRRRGDGDANHIPTPPAPRIIEEPPRRGRRKAARDLTADLDPADRMHIRRVVTALGGKGFPFLAIRSA
ncbi:hypothetical protein [Phenylobacterium sp.]|uniref:hypothetical protein n=1 Tax=Phenylobacterium sp. TaxID=1871053 RepID=UPI00394545F1